MTLKKSLILLALFSLTTPAMAAPQISAIEKSFDFGTLYQGEAVTHVYTFQNSGDAPLVIDKVRSSCGCTAAILSKKNLQPGEQGEVKATFNSSRFRGPITKKVYLYSNDPRQKTYELELKALVKEVLVRTPHRISGGPIQPGEKHTSTLELTNEWKDAVAVTEIVSGLPALQAELDRDALPPGEKATLSISITPDKSQRRINTYVILRTDNPLLPEIRIPVFLLVNVNS